jgi:hypothetical protein
MAHGAGNAPGMGHGPGKGPARGGGFGFGHASVGNPGHNALSTLSSHSQNTSHKGETHDGRSLSSHSHSTQSLAQHHTDHSNKADQVVEVEDRGPGKEKGFVASLPPGKEQQADRGMTLNPATIHSDFEDAVTLGLSPSQEVQPDRGLPLNLEMIHSDLVGIVTLGRPPGQDLQPDRSDTLNLGTIHSNLDDIATRGLAPSLELNLGRGKSLPARWQAKVTLGTSVPDADDTPAIVPRTRWELGDDHTKILPSTKPELEDDDDGWKLVPYFGALLLFFSWIVKSGLGARKRKAASIGSVNGEERYKPFGARPPALDKFAAAFLTGGGPPQKAAGEKKGPLVEHSSGDLDVEKARAEIEYAQEIHETFDKNFNGIGLS